MYIIQPLYQGDISIDSEYENGKITRLVYELDETWNGDNVLAGTDCFIVCGEVLSAIKSGGFKGFELKDMEVIYEGDNVPHMMQIIPDKVLSVKRDEYSEQADYDVYSTENVGELAVSGRLFDIIKEHMKENTFEFHEIYYTRKCGEQDEKFMYEYFIVTACSKPFELIPFQMKKKAVFKNGTYIVKEKTGEVHISAPYLECMSNFDIDIHGYMNIWEPYFLAVRGNDKNAVRDVIRKMCTRNFYVAESFSERFLECLDFVNDEL